MHRKMLVMSLTPCRVACIRECDRLGGGACPSEAPILAEVGVVDVVGPNVGSLAPVTAWAAAFGLLRQPYLQRSVLVMSMAPCRVACIRI